MGLVGIETGFVDQMLDFVRMLPAAAFGALGLYWLIRLSGRQPASLFLILNVDVLSSEAKPLVILADIVLSSILGGLFVLAIADPDTARQSVVAGLGWTGLASIHVAETAANDRTTATTDIETTRAQTTGP